MTDKCERSMKQKLDNPKRRQTLPPKEALLNLGLSESDTFADIGCGIGYFSIPAAQIVNKSGKVYALDISEEMLEEARKAASANNLTNIEFIKNDESNIPLPDNSISYCFSCIVLHEVKDLKGFLKEMVRIVKENGKLVIIEWNNILSDWGPSAERRLSSSYLRELLEAEGLQVDSPINIAENFYVLKCRKDGRNEAKAY